MIKHLLVAAVFFLTACDGMVGVKPSTLVFETKHCAIDFPAANSKISSSKPITINGWAFDEQSTSADKQIRIQFNSNNRASTKAFNATVGGKRPDVAAYFKNPNVESAGFNLVIPEKMLEKGTYEIVVLQDTPNVITKCNYGFTLVVTE